jgi:hypothetical protein
VKKSKSKLRTNDKKGKIKDERALIHPYHG